jgi:hypothetical protein
MITPESVLRDLERGEAVCAKWAPLAVDRLVAAGLVEVRQGWVRRVGPGAEADRLARMRPRWKAAKDRARADRRARGLHPAARDKESRIAAALPATSAVVAVLVGITVEGARKALQRMGAVRVGVEVVAGGGRPRTIWGMP